MLEKEQPFCCAEVIAKDLAKLRRMIAALVLLVILSNVVMGFLVYKFTVKKVFYTYFKTSEAMEKIHKVQINYGTVHDLPAARANEQ